jgi:spore maturation protein CgeB
MKILVCTSYYYYGNPRGVEPQFYYLYKVPESLGYTVDFFDYQTAATIGLKQMRRTFLAILEGSNYDAVFIATRKDEFDQETLSEAMKYSTIIGWNSDDEWRWKNYSKKRADWYTFMVTNSPEVYKENKQFFPNLLHAQWACTGFWDGRKTPKDINFGFAGQVYGSRASQIKWLARHAGLQAFGKGTGNIPVPPQRRNSLRTIAKRSLLRTISNFVLPRISEDLSILNFEQINTLWNRSKISFTPLESSQGNVLQIKSRVFDMGLSGTLMLARPAPNLNNYYEPGKEFVQFEDLKDCAEKAKFYLKNEAARRQIAEAYRKRTKSEHLWKHRIHYVLKEAGLLKQIF